MFIISIALLLCKLHKSRHYGEFYQICILYNETLKIMTLNIMKCWSGVTFEGELRNGVFHGHGTLEWPQKQRIDGVWLRGKLQEKRYTFADGLVYQEKDWNYCQFPDRRSVTQEYYNTISKSQIKSNLQLSGTTMIFFIKSHYD